MNTFFSLHLLELRFRAVYILISFCITFFIGTLYSVPLTHLICIPFSVNAAKAGQCSFFIFTHVTEGLYAAIEVSFISALFFSIPLAVYQMHSFLMPSFHQRERKEINWIFFFVLFFFLISIYTAFLFLLPKMCAFLQQFQYQSKSIQIILQARIAPAVRWSTTVFLVTALFFQIPVIFALLCRGGLPPSFLYENRKYAWFIILLMASLLSPPDVYSQSLFAACGCFLYEILLWSALFYQNLLPSRKTI